jgi:hypothetical protein
MKAVKILGGIVLGLFGLVVLLYLVGLAINWNDEPPSPEALAFQQLLDERPQVSDAQNAYVYGLGFAAAKDQDPVAVGARRMAWIEGFTLANRQQPDPAGEPLEMRSRAPAKVAGLDEQCRDGDRRSCADAFRELAGEWQPDEIESLALQRYHTLLGLRAWREVIPENVAAPLPSYAETIYAQRLYLLELLRKAKQGDAQAVRDGLNAESLYWRSAADNAQMLISQMIAVAGLRNHYFFGNLVLDTLPADKVASAVPPDWEREYSAEERSLRLVLAGELAFNKATLSEVIDASSWDQYEIERNWYDIVSFELSRPFLKVQATLNETAASYAQLCAQFDVPLNRYGEATKALQSAHREASWIAVYNPIGTFLQKLSVPDTYMKYMYRTASTEGMRRAALLVAQMRARAVPVDRVAAEVAGATLRDPYTDAAFEWDAKRESVVFDGPEDHQWHRHEFFY